MYATYTKCIDSSVYPLVEYGSEVWGYVTNPCTDQVQLKAIRAYLGVNKLIRKYVRQILCRVEI